MQDIPVVYIGKKETKRDTVAGTRTVWAGNGSSRLVPRAAAEVLFNFPEIWVDESTFEAMSDQDESEANAAGSNEGEVSKLPIVDPDDAKKAEGEGTVDPATEQTKAPITSVQIQEAIRKLDKGSSNHFTGSGMPKISAVREQLGREDLETKDMNAAFNEIKEEFRQAN